MRIALVAPPFIPVPPSEYGGTELFIAHLAEGLKCRGFSVVVYTNGESVVDVEKRWLFPRAHWPLRKGDYPELREAEHSSWALKDAAGECDIIHLNTHLSITYSQFIRRSFVCTLHHPHEPELASFYEHYPDVDYVSISDFQRRRQQLPRNRTICVACDAGQP